MTVDRFDLNLLSLFDEVMKERHVTRAAENLGITQSAASNALGRLRRLLDDQLFVKVPRGVQPTPRALELWPAIHRSLQELRQHVAPEGFQPAHARQKFRIAMADITAFFITPHLYKVVHKDAPGIHLFFEPTGYAATDLRLQRGELDFAFTIEPPRTSGLKAIPLWSDTFVMAARRGHPLLSARRLSLDAFCVAPHVGINGTGSDEFMESIDQALAAQERARNISLTINQFSILPSILRRSDLVSVVPARFAKTLQARDAIDSRLLPVQVPAVVVYLTWHQRNDSSAANTWIRQRLLDAAAEVDRATREGK